MSVKKNKVPIKPGKYFMQGDEACARGAIAAGCSFFGGYPITPASEIKETIVQRFAELDRTFVQMEDEIGAMAAVIGASWTGAKSMTATSGPGMSLKMENIGYGIMTETPCVIVNVQRTGPSTGQATRTAQGDLMQARWGMHGEHTIIALSPWGVEETYYESIRAFNLAEKYRTPVIVLLEEATGHLREVVNVKEEVEVLNRKKGNDTPPFGGYEPLADIPAMPSFGDGARLLVTGSTHDPQGYRKTQDRATQEKLAEHLRQKIDNNIDDISEYETYFTEDADTLVISFGFAARAGLKAVKKAQADHKKAGMLRLKTVWPMPEKIIKKYSKNVDRIVVPEMNFGQLRREVERFVNTEKVEVVGVNRSDGEVIEPEEIIKVLEN
jgi:2-oxoglutarate ferredoxin oxidoreductase subunit alpha